MAAALVVGERAFATSLSSAALLKLLPSGAYTTARSVGRHGVFDFEQHVRRTAESARLLGGGAETAEALRPRLAASMRLAAAALRAQLHGADGCDLKLTSLLLSGADAVREALARCDVLPPPTMQPLDTVAPLWAQAPSRPLSLLFTHAALLPPRREPPVLVVVRGRGRAQAAAKDSAWVRERADLEAGLPAGFEEALLVDGGGERVLEGTQTNLFAVINGALHTAPEGAVLAGTVRRLVLEVCASDGVRVVLEAPRLDELRPDGDDSGGAGTAGDWEAAFLTSTSRLVLAIDEVHWSSADAAAGSGAALRRRFRPAHPLVARLERLVGEAVKVHCSDVL